MELTLAEKLKCVMLHLKDGIPLYEVANTQGIDVGRLKYCVALYLKWGEKAFKVSKERRTFTREIKLQAIKDVLNNGISLRQKGIELMLSDPSIVRDWVHLYKTKGEAAIKDTYSREAYKHHDDKVLEKEYKKLLEDLERTKAENEYLKKSYSLILKRGKPSKKKS